MTITNVKAMVAKVLTVGVLAGAVVMAAPAKAEAQGFAVGVRFGAPVRPVYVAPRYYGPRYVVPAYGYGYGYRHDGWAYDRYHHGPVYGYRR
ncbi:hypothetical protein SAMN05421770_101104 [Granulicella rosea]|uniref:PXPV repeat-containing protein n=1 Tax=Granulicella rosea TaxID=474952 RepID=A0A239CTD2_9BACT|nr:hypothetical protein [Granulicella rosea]SNS23506.1 hypothetical protein SAMN05421770_101104 [Granulicella rosea]